MSRPINRLIARGISEEGIEDELAQAIAYYEEWTGPLRNHRRRLWQALAENTDRKFDAQWALLAVRLFAYHERDDLADALIGLFSRERWAGDNERPDDGAPRKMRMARPQERRREVG